MCIRDRDQVLALVAAVHALEHKALVAAGQVLLAAVKGGEKRDQNAGKDQQQDNAQAHHGHGVAAQTAQGVLPIGHALSLIHISLAPGGTGTSFLLCICPYYMRFPSICKPPRLRLDAIRVFVRCACSPHWGWLPRSPRFIVFLERGRTLPLPPAAWKYPVQPALVLPRPCHRQWGGLLTTGAKKVALRSAKPLFSLF